MSVCATLLSWSLVLSLCRYVEGIFKFFSNFFRYLITDNGANVIKAVRLLQDPEEGRDQMSGDSDSSADEDDGNQRFRASLNPEEEEEEFHTRETELNQEITNLGKKRGKCFR